MLSSPLGCPNYPHISSQSPVGIIPHFLLGTYYIIVYETINGRSASMHLKSLALGLVRGADCIEACFLVTIVSPTSLVICAVQCTRL